MAKITRDLPTTNYICEVFTSWHSLILYHAGDRPFCAHLCLTQVPISHSHCHLLPGPFASLPSLSNAASTPHQECFSNTKGIMKLPSLEFFTESPNKTGLPDSSVAHSSLLPTLPHHPLPIPNPPKPFTLLWGQEMPSPALSSWVTFLPLSTWKTPTALLRELLQTHLFHEALCTSLQV